MGAIINECCNIQASPKRQKIPKPIKIKKEKDIPHKKQEQQVQKTNLLLQKNAVIFNEQAYPESSEEFYQIESLIDERQRSLLQPKHINLNSFQIMGPLGDGSFGTVLQVKYKEDIQSQREMQYAMKVIPKQKLTNAKSMSCAKLQRQILGKINNPFITSLKFAFVDKSNFYLVMQSASGGDLSKIISKQFQRQFLKQHCLGYIPFIAANIILGLECLHQEKIMYRDLKLQNVLIFSNGYLKLSDFGLSTVLVHEDEKRKTNAGTALYQAPEVVLQLGYNWAVDLWALGVIIFQLQTGMTPFKLQDVSTKVRYKRIAQQQQIKRKWRGCQIQDNLRDLIASLLKYNPYQRIGYRHFEQLKHHPYFKTINWQDIYQQKTLSPLLPLLNSKKVSNKESLEMKDNITLSLSLSFFQSIPIQDDWNYNYKSKSST